MPSLRTSAGLLASGVVHASILVALISKGNVTYLPVETFAPIEVVPPPPTNAPSPAAPPPKPEPLPEPETQVRSLRPAPATAKSELAAEPPPQASPQPVALAGLSLSNIGLGMNSGNGSGFMPTGHATRPAPNAPAGTAPAAPRAPDLTSLADLSRKPSPPALAAALARHYPAHLRASGVEGQALVRVIVGRAGEVQTTTLLSETHSGFGNACQKALQGSRWGPPIDQFGKATATSLQYRCRFTVGL